MLSRDHLHSLILVPVGELMPRLDARSRSRLAWAITNRLHPTVVEQIMREVEREVDHGGSAAGHVAAIPADAAAHVSGVRSARDHLNGAAG